MELPVGELRSIGKTGQQMRRWLRTPFSVRAQSVLPFAVRQASANRIFTRSLTAASFEQKANLCLSILA